MSALDRFRLLERHPAPVPEPPVPGPSYENARAEVTQALRRLGLLFGRHPDDAGLPLGDFVVAAYRSGWQACEVRIDSPDMADAISTALASPDLVLERLPNESEANWKVRAVRQVVAYGLAKR